MNDPTLVSVIVPTYKRAAIIHKTIDSVLQQTHINFELIIVDDFSSDIEQLQQVIESYNDQRIHLIKHNTNKNGATARNTGIEFAKGEFIAFLDSDDLWHKDKLMQHLKLANKMTKNSIQYCKLRCYCSASPHDIMLRPDKSIEKEQKLGDYLFVENEVMQTSGLFLSSSFAKQIMFNENLVRHQDYDFLLRAEDYGANFIFVNEPLVDYIWLATDKINTKSISVLNSLTWLDNYKKYLSQEAQLGFIKKEILPTAIRTRKIIPLFQYLKQNYHISICFRMVFYFSYVFTKLAIGKVKRTIKKVLKNYDPKN